MIQIGMPMPEKCSDCIFCNENCSCVASDYNGIGINVGCAYRAGRRDVRCPLKEQENKKLIDADKLREKLGFAECCEDCKRDPWKCGRETIYSLYDLCASIDIAIEELMQEGR